jgi:hypothetical protein
MFGFEKMFGGAPEVKKPDESLKNKVGKKLRGAVTAAAVGIAAMSPMKSHGETPVQADKSDEITLEYKGHTDMGERLEQIQGEKTLEQLQKENAKTNEKNWEHNRGIDDKKTGTGGITMAQ